MALDCGQWYHDVHEFTVTVLGIGTDMDGTIGSVVILPYHTGQTLAGLSSP